MDLRIHVRIGFQKCGQDFGMILLGHPDHGGPTGFVRRVNLCSCLDERLNSIRFSAARGPDQGRLAVIIDSIYIRA